jgi:hypothetical protein
VCRPVSEWEPECHPLALAVAPGDPGREPEERRLPAVVEEDVCHAHRAVLAVGMEVCGGDGRRRQF